MYAARREVTPGGGRLGKVVAYSYQLYIDVTVTSFRLLTQHRRQPKKMFAIRLLAAQTGRRPEQDMRLVEKILDAAAERLGKPRQPHIAQTFAAHDVLWAWQLAELSEANWERLDVPVGLQTAIRAEIAYPSSAEPNHIDARPVGETNDRLRRFLLLPDANGDEAKPLRSLSGFFLGILSTPVADRQNLLLALCELIALIGGLYLPISLEFRRSIVSAAPELKGFEVSSPSLLDVMDAAMLLIFVTVAVITCMAVYMALVFAAGGYHPDDKFCEGAMMLIAVFFFSFALGVQIPIMLSLVWHVFTDSGSPYPAIGALVVASAMFYGLSTMMFGFLLEHMSLELYHWPRWLKLFVIQQVPWYKRRFDDAILKPKAEKRAAKLRAQRAQFVLNSSPGPTA